jgi:hypothetical protein
MSGSSLVSRSHLDLAYLDLICVRGHRRIRGEDDQRRPRSSRQARTSGAMRCAASISAAFTTAPG